MERCEGIVRRLAEEGLTRTWANKVMRVVYAAWTWASDEPELWPGLPPAPRDVSKVVPRPGASRRPPPAPSWEEMDAIVRAARVSRAPALWQLRFFLCCTGLRVGEGIALEARDVDLQADVPVMRVHTGKVAAHRGRVVPLAPVLVPGRSTAGRPFDAYRVRNEYRASQQAA